MHRILLIEDDLPLAETTKEYLENFGFDVSHVADGKEGAEAAMEGAFDLILLDLMLPSIDGLEICRRLRAFPATLDVPVIMLTARGDETDRIVGLELGADDYLPKPFSLRELVARIRANLRRSSAIKREPTDLLHSNAPSSAAPTVSTSTEGEMTDEVLRIGMLEINRLLRTAEVGGEELVLTATEFEILWIFASSPRRVMTREQLLDQVRGREFDAFDRSIDVHISKLRKKMEVNPKKPQFIQTVWGVGYRFVPPENK